LFEGTIRMNLDPLEERADQEIWEVHPGHFYAILMLNL